MGSIPSIIAELCTFSETYKKNKKNSNLISRYAAAIKRGELHKNSWAIKELQSLKRISLNSLNKARGLFRTL